MNILNKEFVAELRIKNIVARHERHPQFEEIHNILGRADKLYAEVAEETKRRVSEGIALRGE